MTLVPLPASPCVRVKLDYTQSDGFDAGSRFFLSYTGSAPTAANCVTLATDIATLWNTQVAAAISNTFTLSEVDVQDIASYTGAFGTVGVSHQGGDTSTALPANCATNVEFDIARRYRGGKPRMYWPPPGNSEVHTAGQWSSTFVTGMNGYMSNFFGGIEALSVGSMGTLAHVNLSYYKGFTNVTNSSGRTRAAPKYRDAALVDIVTGYATKQEIGSQRRRRNATTF